MDYAGCGWWGPSSPPPGWVDGPQPCTGSFGSKPPTPDRRAAAAERATGALGQPQGLAKPQVCYETLPVVETFLRDRLPRLLPHASWLATLPALLSALSLGLWPHSFLSLPLSSSVSATSTGEQHFLLSLSLSGVQPGGP